MWKRFVALTAIASQATTSDGFVASPISLVENRRHQPAIPTPWFDKERRSKELATTCTADIVSVGPVQQPEETLSNYLRQRHHAPRLGPIRRVSSFFQKLVTLANPRDEHWRGTRAHVNNILISLAIPLYFLLRRASAGSIMSKTVLSLGFLGLAFDNVVNASGKYIGEGNTLKLLCKIRSISHAMTIPLLFIPVIEAGMLSGLFPTTGTRIAMGTVVAFAAHETVDWLSFDIHGMTAVDNRNATKNSAHAIAGTLSYTSGRVLKNVLPCVTLTLFILAVGSALMKSGVPAGSWLLASGLITFVSCSIRRPDVQCYSEPTMMGLIWASTASCVA